MRQQTKPFPRPFGEKLNKVRHRLGMTQEDLAIKLDFSISTISKWCQGKQAPIVLIQKEIAKRLGLDEKELVDNDED